MRFCNGVSLLQSHQASPYLYEIARHHSTVKNAMIAVLCVHLQSFMARLRGIVLNLQWKETIAPSKYFLEGALLFFAMPTVTITLHFDGLRLAMAIVMLSILLYKCLAYKRHA